jgi:hypothetical protein
MLNFSRKQWWGAFFALLLIWLAVAYRLVFLP